MKYKVIYKPIFASAMVLAIVAFSAPFASAHAELVSANPASGAVLKKLPGKIVLEFDENLLVLNAHNTNVLIVKDRFGTEVDAGNSALNGRVLSVDMVASEEFGDFSVTYRVVSDDGHPVQSSYNFSVVIPVGATTQDLPLTSLIHESVPKFDAEKAAKTVSNPEPRMYGSWILLALAFVGVGIWAKFDLARRRKSRSENTDT